MPRAALMAHAADAIENLVSTSLSLNANLSALCLSLSNFLPPSLMLLFRFPPYLSLLSTSEHVSSVQDPVDLGKLSSSESIASQFNGNFPLIYRIHSQFEELRAKPIVCGIRSARVYQSINFKL